MTSWLLLLVLLPFPQGVLAADLVAGVEGLDGAACCVDEHCVAFNDLDDRTQEVCRSGANRTHCSCHRDEPACNSVCGNCRRCYHAGGEQLCDGPFVHGPCGDPKFPYRSLDECKAAVSDGKPCGYDLYNVCLYNCPGPPAFTYQKCVVSHNDGLKFCPPLPGGVCPATEPYRVPNQAACEKFDCEQGKEPFNQADPTACSKAPPTSSPSLDDPSPARCKKVAPHVYESCAGIKPWLIDYGSIPFDCTVFCSGKVLLKPCPATPCCTAKSCVQECMMLLQGDACQVTNTSVSAVDETTSACNFVPNEPPYRPQWCPRSAEEREEAEAKGLQAELPPSRPTAFRAPLGVAALRAGPDGYNDAEGGAKIFWRGVEEGNAKLHYEVVRTRDVVSLDELGVEVLKGVTCEPGALTLQPGSPAGASKLEELIRPGVLVSGGPEWGCLKPGGRKPGALLRHVVAVRLAAVGEPPALLLDTAEAKLTDAIRSGTISFSTRPRSEAQVPRSEARKAGDARGAQALHGEAWEASTAVAVEPAAPSPLGVGGFWDNIGNAVRSAWNAVKKVADDVAKAAKKAEGATKAATGNFHLVDLFGFSKYSWNYDDVTHRAQAHNVNLPHNFTCKECFFHFEASLHVDIEIRDYKITHAAVWAEGDAKTTMELHGRGAMELPEVSAELMDIPLVDEGCIPVALIPLCLGAELQVDAFVGPLSLAAGPVDQVHARISANGTLKQGVYFDGEDLHRINDGTLMPLAGDSHLMGLGGTVSLQAGLFPKIIFNIDVLGGPTIGVRTALEVLAVGPSAAKGVCEHDATFASLALGVQLSLGAKLEAKLLKVPLWKREWPPIIIWSHKWPVRSGCFALPALASASDGVASAWVEAPLADGTQPVQSSVLYAGFLPVKESAPPACTGLQPLKLAVQIVQMHDATHAQAACDVGFGDYCPRVIKASSARWVVPVPGDSNGKEQWRLTSYNPTASAQAELLAVGDELVEISGDDYVALDQSSEEQISVPAVSFTVRASPDLSTLTLTPIIKGSCYEAGHLHRSASAVAAAHAALQEAQAASRKSRPGRPAPAEIVV